MKLTATLALLCTLFVNEAMAQRRPPPPRPPRPVPVPPRNPPPVPRPAHVCNGPDLYQYNWLIHRFRWTNDCREALRDIAYRGRFCDEGAMFDRNGYFIAQYRDRWECRSWL